jgi:hypothetical protein
MSASLHSAEMGGSMPPAEEQDYAAKEAEYRAHAAKLFQLAEQTQNESERDQLRRMADAWISLAARMKELSDGGN